MKQPPLFRLPVAPTLIGLAAAVLLSLPCPAFGNEPAKNLDTDGDGLSDFVEKHKHHTNPATKDSDGDGKPDSDPHERREYAYTLRTVVRILKPYDLAVMTDDYQDARLLRETDTFGEIEVIHYPLNTVKEGIGANLNWQAKEAANSSPTSSSKAQVQVKWLKPGITTNWDAAMRETLLKELRAASIDPEHLSDREVAQQVSRWLLKVTQSPGYMFTTYFMDFDANSGKPVLLPGCEAAYAREKGKAGWSFDEQLQREVLGAGMFATKTRGTCTSSAVLWTTVFRALGLPCRMVLCIPALDGNDKEQLKKMEQRITHHRVRDTLMKGLSKARGFSAHTFNEVFIDGRWVRLNYGTLGQNILDEHYFGLMTHTLTFADLSDANLAKTWGKRYALGEKSADLPTSNPFTMLEISDQFGAHAKNLDNPPVPKPADHEVLTIEHAIWADSAQRPAWLSLENARQGARGGVVALLRPVERFADQDYRQYRRFLDAADEQFTLKAPDGGAVNARLTLGYFTTSQECEIALVVSAEDHARMQEGVAYAIVPANGKKGAPKWAVKEGVVLVKE